MVAPHVYGRPESSEKMLRVARKCTQAISNMGHPTWVSVAYLPNDLVFRGGGGDLKFRWGVPLIEVLVLLFYEIKKYYRMPSVL